MKNKFEEIKKCLLIICSEYNELNKYGEEIKTVTKEEQLEKIKTEILSLKLELASEIARKINVCSNEYNAEKPYGKLV